MDKGSSIYIAGHRGLVGSAIARRLRALGFTNILTRTHKELDLLEQAAVRRFFEIEKPEYVFLAAAKVGGIHANDSYPAEFIRDNLLIQTNVIDAAWRSGVKKLCFLGSSCIYPKLAPQPINEKHLLTGPLEPTNEWYAIAKIAGIKMCQAYRRQYDFSAISLMPTNLYGPGDNFDLQSSHVLPALLRKFHEAKEAGSAEVVVWGTGKPRREFLHVDDMADASVHLMRVYDEEQIVNVGVGQDVTIAELAEYVRDAVGYTGRVVFDPSMPDGTPRKLLDVTRLHATGWRAKVPLDEGIRQTYEWYLENVAPPRLMAL
ncbi:GDP-L-fucose synthase [Desulfocurvibacter africanus]|uniref:GDP-L-fucose synthase n=1 Tax=Desulfocurvibacter africanus subsp. africanus str. Walvis Bay TaxID=690850 RepID=F3YWA5_DESAF|nr:GDP-L-fucose synthase [Desulfocurvibacter africanus]EGJ49208.1 GDP-L-fucose synthase [Desulfocurvibacter africanus subsp. africanus str. Walvis Bay]